MERTQLIIVRHGQTQWNIANIRQGHLDSELTDIGIAQAKALAQRLLRERFSALYSSDLGRAVQTAQIIAEAPVRLSYFSSLFVKCLVNCRNFLFQ